MHPPILAALTGEMPGESVGTSSYVGRHKCGYRTNNLLHSDNQSSSSIRVMLPPPQTSVSQFSIPPSLLLPSNVFSQLLEPFNSMVVTEGLSCFPNALFYQLYCQQIFLFTSSPSTSPHLVLARLCHPSHTFDCNPLIPRKAKASFPVMFFIVASLSPRIQHLLLLQQCPSQVDCNHLRGEFVTNIKSSGDKTYPCFAS